MPTLLLVDLDWSRHSRSNGYAVAGHCNEMWHPLNGDGRLRSLLSAPLDAARAKWRCRVATCLLVSLFPECATAKCNASLRCWTQQMVGDSVAMRVSCALGGGVQGPAWSNQSVRRQLAPRRKRGGRCQTGAWKPFLRAGQWGALKGEVQSRLGRSRGLRWRPGERADPWPALERAGAGPTLRIAAGSAEMIAVYMRTGVVRRDPPCSTA